MGDQPPVSFFFLSFPLFRSSFFSPLIHLLTFSLPFYEFPDAALGIAVKTFLDESAFDTTAEQRESRKKEFPKKFVPHALKPFEDFDVVFGLVEALQTGLATLGNNEMKADAKADWDKAKKYLDRRR